MLPSGTVTFLFTDVEGSTALWESRPDFMEGALKQHNEALDRVAAEFSGCVFKTIGDAYCIAFAGADDAADAALAAQSALTKAERPLGVRMALHTANIHPTGDDYFGTPLNRTARLLSAANAGQILMSEATKVLLPNSMAAKDLGTHVLRDLMEPTRIWQLGPGDFGPIKTVTTVPNNLPLQTTSFIGREEEMRQIEELLAKSRMITLTGTGGTGKSRLSLQFAADHTDRFPDGAWFCELATIPDREDVLRAIGTAVGAPEIAGVSLRDRITMHLSGKRCLVIVDNCEHVLDSASKIVEDIVSSCAGVVVMATSREPLGVKGEVAFRVPSLPSPDPARKLSLDDLEAFGSTALFLDRLSVAAPSYDVQPQEASTVAQICQRLDGIPLAIELAAARGRAMSLEQIEKRLNDRFRLLTGGNRNALSRQQTLRALIDWSVQLLDQRERQFLIGLSVFGGGWDLDAAENVCADEAADIESWQVLDLMTTLVDKSLVVFEPAADRYRLLESIRQYSLEQLENDPRALTLRDRHADYFLGLGQTIFISVEAHGKFLADYENFRMAVEWSSGTEEGRERAIIALSNLISGFHSMARLPEFVRLMDGLLAGGQRGCTSDAYDGGRILSIVARILSGDPKGLESAREARQSLEHIDPSMRAQWRAAIGHSLFAAGEFEEAIFFIDETIDTANAQDLGIWLRYLHVHKGNCLTALHRFGEAEAELKIAQDALEAAGDERGAIANLANHIALFLAWGKMPEAIRIALDLMRRSTTARIYMSTRSFGLLTFGHLALDQGNVDLASRFYSGAVAIRDTSGIAPDPVDLMAEHSLRDRLSEALPGENRETYISKGRAIDWEPWFQAMVPVKAEDVLAASTIPFAELINSGR